MRHQYILFFFLTLPFFVQAQSTYFVKQNATGNQNGLSWHNAFTNLQQALQVADAGDAVWVAEGIYYPDNGSDRGKTFTLNSGVQLLGGFQGTETNPAQRDIDAHPVVLSGDVGNIGDTTDNSNNIMLMPYPQPGTLVEGFTFRHGYAQTDTLAGVFSLGRAGAAVYVLVNDSIGMPVFRHCNFFDNYASGNGGAIFFKAGKPQNCTPLFQYCHFFNNKCGQRGGAVYWQGGSQVDPGVEIDHCIFEKNKATGFGGGLYVYQSVGKNNFEIDASTLKDNTNPTSLGAFLTFLADKANVDTLRFTSMNCELANTQIFGTVDFHFLQSEDFSLPDIPAKYHLSSNKFKNAWNLFLEDYGGQSTYSEFIDNQFYNSGRFSNSFNYLGSSKIVFKNNFAYNSFYNSHSGNREFNFPAENLLFSGNTIVSDTVVEYGIQYPTSHNNAKVIIEKNLFANLSGSPQQSKIVGGVLAYEEGNEVVFRNNILYNFQMPDIGPPSGLEANSKPVRYTFQNNIFNKNKYANGNPAMYLTTTQDTVLLLNNLADFDCGQFPPLYSCGQGHILTSDPMFKNVQAGDFHLQPCSPGVDAGSDSIFVWPHALVDLDGRPRTLGNHIDIGPFELPNISNTGTPPLVQGACNGTQSGSVSFMPEFACPPLSLAWENALTTGTGGTGLSPGDYQFTITDGRGRQVTDHVTVPILPAIHVSPMVSAVQCGDTLGGTATLVPSEGLAPYKFLWENGDTMSQIEHLAKGNYTFTVTDARLCQTVGAANIGTIGQVSYAVQSRDVHCYDGTDGFLRIVPSNGLSPYTYKWVEGGQTNDSLTMLSAANYAGTLTDALGCEAAWSVQVAQPDSLRLIAQLQPASGPTHADGSIQLQTEGGTPPYHYNWSNGVVGAVNADLLPGDYTLTLTDGNNCEKIAVFSIPYTMGVDGNNNAPILVRAYPIPANTVLHIDNIGNATGEQGLKCRLTDALGRQVLMQTSDSPNLTLSVKDLASGHYVLTVETHLGRIQKGVVITH